MMIVDKTHVYTLRFIATAGLVTNSVPSAIHVPSVHGRTYTRYKAKTNTNTLKENSTLKKKTNFTGIPR